ncbi:MAG: hypothetical protein JSV88_32890 [Candidatus Aminicenantes bacterium]|nr:MAG: hypothetical protein JSV88_32890 [Candidatus Aminicenantes bacterium]
MNQLNQQKPALLMVGKGGKKEGMGHLVRISALVEVFAPCYEVTLLTMQDRFGDFFFKQKGITCFTYQDNRGLYRFLEEHARHSMDEKYAVIIIDIYRISIDVIKKIENYCHVLVNFDDMQRRVQHSIKGIFLCPQEPFKREIMNRRRDTVVKGTDYFPLRRIFTRYREKKRFRKDVLDIGIILGGVPSQTHTLKLTQLLDRFLDKKIKLHIVMGFAPGGSHFDTTLFSSRVKVVKNVDNMAAFIEKIDAGIIAGGFIKFEMMCIGTPFVLISLADHQHWLARKFAAQGYGVYLGKIKDLLSNPNKFKQEMETFLSDETLRKQMFSNSRQLVDGKGSDRVLEMVNSFAAASQSSIRRRKS